MDEDDATETVDPEVMRAHMRTKKTLRGKWHLDRLLGVGGMAAVYAATHRNGTRAAVKILHPELSVHGHAKSRFLKEGYVANKVHHPGVVRVLDDDVAEDGSIYLVMELLDGESLEARRVRKGGTLGVDEVLSIADQILDVLAVAHEKGVVHRDIKPENIFLTRDGVVKVLDFGIARLRELSTASTATQTGTTMGTPAFMAPEHARGLWDEVDAQSDLWSVGATMFALATGRMVHEARTANELLVAAVTQKAPKVKAVDPELPTPLAEVVDTALAYEKADRWPNARAMQEGVRTAYDRIRHAPIHSYPPLAVPETVPNRTLPSADLHLPPAASPSGTGSAVAVGQTGIPLRTHSGLAVHQNALIFGGIVGLGAFIAVAVVAVAIWRDRPTGAAGSAAASAPMLGTAETWPASAGSREGADARTDAPPAVDTAAPTASTPVVSLSDLPPAKPAPKAVLAPPKQLGMPAKPPTVQAAPTKPKVDWKEQRR